MTMRTHKLATYLRPEDACILIEFLDQVRDRLMQAYGDDITAMLQKASAPQEPGDLFGAGEPF